MSLLLLPKADREAVLRSEIVHARAHRRIRRRARNRVKGHRTFTVLCAVIVFVGLSVAFPSVVFGSFLSFLFVGTAVAVLSSTIRQDLRVRRLARRQERRAARLP